MSPMLPVAPGRIARKRRSSSSTASFPSFPRAACLIPGQRQDMIKGQLNLKSQNLYSIKSMPWHDVHRFVCMDQAVLIKSNSIACSMIRTSSKSLIPLGTILLKVKRSLPLLINAMCLFPRHVYIDQYSINTMAVNENPHYKHQKMLVAGSVFINSSGARELQACLQNTVTVISYSQTVCHELLHAIRD